MKISPEANSPWGNRSHTKSCFPMGNSHFPFGKMASVTTPVVFVIFGLCRLCVISIPVNFSSMVVGFVIFAVSSRAFHYLIFISLLLFVNGPAKFCNFCYFRCFRNNCAKFWGFSKFFWLSSTANLSPLLWPRGWALIRGRALIDRNLVVFVVFFIIFK